MKSGVTVIFLLLLFQLNSTLLFGQKGYQYIANAESAIDSGDIKSAHKYLKKARKADYGFCGNAWIEAEKGMLLVEAKILSEEGKYLQAEEILANLEMDYGFRPYSPTFLHAKIKEVGKDSLKNYLLNQTDKINWVEHYSTQTEILGFPRPSEYTIGLPLPKLEAQNIFSKKGKMMETKLQSWIHTFFENYSGLD